MQETEVLLQITLLCDSLTSAPMLSDHHNSKLPQIGIWDHNYIADLFSIAYAWQKWICSSVSFSDLMKRIEWQKQT